ncbi:MAG: deoxyguanosinetriphosphate triphosphohydrolase [Candidatus Brocadiia bacterium]
MRREELEEQEAEMLAPYAARSAGSAGRRHDEPEADYRTCYQRDRDRIIHCKAFRRLEYKTQVFLNHEGDHYRTRLTHTMEVTQIARTIARALALNEDLTEAVALAHDVGHTPFGHTGETTLNRLMARHGGFEHNAHGLRVVDLLERQYPQFPGLNLTREVRESMVKHQTRWDQPEAGDFGAEPPLLEAQVVAVADSIAYDNHDLQDGLEAGILQVEQLAKVDLWREAEGSVSERFGPLSGEQLAGQAVRYLIDLFVTDVVRTTRDEIRDRRLSSVEDVRSQPDVVVHFSAQLQSRKDALEEFLFDRLYQNYKVVQVTHSARLFVEGLFEAFCAEPRQLPPEHREWAEQVGLERAVCDYVAGMTDRYAQDQYIQLFEPYQKL